MDKRVITGIILFFIYLSGCISLESRDAAEEGVVYLPIEGRDIAGVEKKLEKARATLRKPVNFESGNPSMVPFTSEAFECTLYAKSFAQGNAVYGEFVYKKGFKGAKNVSFRFKGEDIPLTATRWGYRCFMAIHPEQKPGKVDGTFAYTINGTEQKLTLTLDVKDVEYPVSKKAIDLGKFSDQSYANLPENKKYIALCTELRTKAFSSASTDSIGSTLSHPRNFHKVTGAYWNKRKYLTYKKKKKKKVRNYTVSYHRGVDLKGDFGAPVYAMADGVVVLSYKMFYEGNMIVIDHGNKVFSYYMHMDSRGVNAGDRVKAGQRIGKVGSTGTSTGPHLHFAVSIRGVHVDPLSFLWLPVNR